MAASDTLDLNDQFKAALYAMENSRQNIFVTGKAGTGKSTLLSYFRDHTQKSFAVLAPTGVAAVNIEGQTIHSFFKFRPDVTVDRVKRRGSSKAKTKTIYQKLQVLIIDEISMVRADLMDCMEKFMRLNGPIPGEPFGGVQIIVFGDLFQLPPVVKREDWDVLGQQYKSPHFFSAHCAPDLDFQLIELGHIYRQQDPEFIAILNKIRSGHATNEDLSQLNDRCYNKPNDLQSDLTITLTGTNKLADEINDENLEALDEKYHLFEGELSGEFRQDSLPSPLELKLKPGAQIMMTNNDPKQRWINGTMGKIMRISQNDDYELVVRVELESGKRVNVSKNTWDMTKYVVDGEKISTEIIGSYNQYPLKLAWAITIHKSQGKTFDDVVIDLGRSAFAAGQTYVALSRCRTLEGITLTSKLSNRHIISDHAVTKFLVSLTLKKAQEHLSDHEKLYRIGDAIESASDITIDYIRMTGEISNRRIEPESLGQATVDGQQVDTLKAYCHVAQRPMTFSIPQILKIHKV